MPETKKLSCHPFHVECLLFVLDAARPGPGNAARLRLSELWEKVHLALWPGLPLTETGVRWINPTSTPAQLEATRRAAKDGALGEDPPTCFDPAAAPIVLELSHAEAVEAKKHLDNDLDQAQLNRIRALQPLAEQLEKAAS